MHIYKVTDGSFFWIWVKIPKIKVKQINIKAINANIVPKVIENCKGVVEKESIPSVAKLSIYLRGYFDLHGNLSALS